ncbi:hypothetical protein AAU57_07080 [Nonlabens sp. YIK11]|uniref:DUF2141 domain-containing protein n=1 Tax=Nonlabens sp. YIK11 TaxID=1453349 RepID=UPI0006DC194A|nr:DUF2141 domain-containing protein [Nonlabens sp. YIK11]KQC33106.1 hypothetical protein AAU57_07080 [Nonlabens sp. YIK11]
MKTLMTTLVLILISAFAKAQTPPSTVETYTITVNVDNARNDNGEMIFSLSTKDQFMKAAPLMAASSSIKDGVATVTFENVPKGEYAIIVLQDLNGNKQMDFEVNGMPKESYGVSNNVMSYGPPTWAEAKFEVTENTTLRIAI